MPRFPVNGLVLVAFALVGCLPVDTRAPPATVLVSLRSSPATLQGFDTADDWRVTFDRVLVTVGGSSFAGDNCTSYDLDRYLRLLDGRSKTPQKVGIVYGLDTCTFEYLAGNPASDTILGTGVTEAEKKSMRDAGTDPWQTNKGVTFIVRGSAQKGTERKSFDWAYRAPRVLYTDCVRDDGTPFTVSLVGEASLAIDLEVHAETLLRDGLPADANLVFDPIASSDANADSIVTLAELAAAPLPASIVAPPGSMWKTLGDLLYLGLFPRILRPAAASCTPNLDGGRHGPAR